MERACPYSIFHALIQIPGVRKRALVHHLCSRIRTKIVGGRCCSAQVDDPVATCRSSPGCDRPQGRFCNWQVRRWDTATRCHTIQSGASLREYSGAFRGPRHRPLISSRELRISWAMETCGRCASDTISRIASCRGG